MLDDNGIGEGWSAFLFAISTLALSGVGVAAVVALVLVGVWL